MNNSIEISGLNLMNIFGFCFELNFELNHFQARFNEKMNFQKRSPTPKPGPNGKGLGGFGSGVEKKSAAGGFGSGRSFEIYLIYSQTCRVFLGTSCI